MAGASLVQDLWLGFSPRLRGRRLAPWEDTPARLLLQLDPAQSLDHPPVAALLESLAARVEVLAWQPRGGAGTPGPELLEDARELAAEGGRRFGAKPVLLGGHGLSAWAALALSATPGLSGVLALAPSLARAGATAPAASPLRAALAAALIAGPPPSLPLLVVEGRERPAPEARVVAEWVTRAAGASLLVVPGSDDALLSEPWPSTIAAWLDARGRASS